MQIKQWFTGGGHLLLSFLYSFFAEILAIIQNVLIKEEWKHYCRYYKRHFRFLAQNYNFLSVPEFCEKNNIAENSYTIQTGKVYIMNDLYVSVFDACTYIHDADKNVFNESFPSNNVKTVWCEAVIKKSSNVIYVDKAVDFALKWMDNYWHFTMTALDKISLFLENGYDGKFIVFDKPYLRELLKLYGIPNDRLIFVKSDEVYKVNELHILDDGMSTTVHRDIIQRIRARILKNIDFCDADKYPKRLYIRRLKPYKRLVKNEAEVIDYLKQFGFETIFPDDYSVEEQIKYFYAADIIVAPHGGCSTNALFMRSDTSFIELFGFNYVCPFMLDIIKDNKMYYNMVVERGDYDTVPAHPNSAYNVDIKLLDDILYKYIQAAESPKY